jgi:hypothetical protein
MFFTSQKSRIWLCFCLLLIFAPAAFAQIEWRPVSPSELQMKTPQVEADADAEAIFWEIRLDDKKSDQLAYNHYVRVKIFTERGREKFSKIDIPFVKGKKVKDIAARVIKADGTIVDVAQTDIFERDLIRAGGVKIKAKSFAMPGIEPGVIVEYQYRETFKGDSASAERLVFQRDIPMQRITYYVRPYPGTKLNFTSFNMQDVRFVLDEKSKFYVGTMTNVPAMKAEPYMPPDDQVRSWTFLTYAPFGIENQMIGSLFSWGIFSSQYGGLQAKITKGGKLVKKTAEDISNGVNSEDEKLRKIYEFAQTQIKNLSYDNTLTEEQREKIDIDKIDDILKNHAGNAFHVNMLFSSLASAAGFETRLMFSSNRSEIFFDPQKLPHASFLHWAGIGVKVGGQWKFFDPGTPYLAYGDMFWHDENTSAMLIDESGYAWVKTPLANYEKSMAKRTGKFRLSEDGTLEGEVRVEYTGNQAVSRREGSFRESATKREEEFKEEMKQRMSTAEVSAISIENVENPSNPLTLSYKVRVPNYAQKTGKRLFLQPGYFEYGSNPLFSSATRKYDIFFPYPWSEKDDIEIQLPQGFALDSAESPGTVADPSKIGSLDIRISIDKEKNLLIYKRNFYFGGGSNTLFSASVYQPLKNLFDAFHKSDAHTITLKQN